MSTTALSPTIPSKRLAVARRGPWRRVGALAAQKPLGTASALILLLLVLMAIFAPLVAPYDPLKTSLLDTRKPPSLQHLFGTDEVGRDQLSRIIFGAQVTLLIGFSAVMLGR